MAKFFALNHLIAKRLHLNAKRLFRLNAIYFLRITAIDWRLNTISLLLNAVIFTIKGNEFCVKLQVIPLLIYIYYMYKVVYLMITLYASHILLSISCFTLDGLIMKKLLKLSYNLKA